VHPILISGGVGYLLGSIPFGYLLVRAFHGSDVRATGSGNIGATNVARTSPVLGLATLFFDALKGAGAVLVVSRIFPDDKSLAFAAGLAAVSGHVFPVWLRFRGGKGVATGLGGFLLLTPKAAICAIGIFLVLAAAFRVVALASIIATASVPFLAIRLGEGGGQVGLALVWTASFIIIAKHYSNIRRIFAGTEPKFQLQFRGKPQ